jgi:hypothetical protein
MEPDKKRMNAAAPCVCGVMTGERRSWPAFAGSAGLSPPASSSTVPVIPSVTATPNAMSAMSALRSARSALSVVGFDLKSDFADSAWSPKIVPTTAPTPPSPSVT